MMSQQVLLFYEPPAKPGSWSATWSGDEVRIDLAPMTACTLASILAALGLLFMVLFAGLVFIGRQPGYHTPVALVLVFFTGLMLLGMVRVTRSRTARRLIVASPEKVGFIDRPGRREPLFHKVAAHQRVRVERFVLPWLWQILIDRNLPRTNGRSKHPLLLLTDADRAKAIEIAALLRSALKLPD